MNLGKSVMVPMGKLQNIRSLASIFGSKVTSLPMKYLGLLLGASSKVKAIWDGVVEKMEMWQEGKGCTCQKGEEPH